MDRQGFLQFFLSAGCDSFAHALKKSFLAAVWFAFVTFPIMVIRVNTIEHTVDWHWQRLGYVVLAVFFGSFVWRWLLARKELKKDESKGESRAEALLTTIQSHKILKFVALGVIAALALAFPEVFDLYQTNIMISCLVYVVLGLGLNIVVGLAGLLDLGYVAFYAVGAYAYALCNMHWGVGFWFMLPVGAVLGAILGLLLGFPVLRLRGDYLAIVTLGFGEIIRLVLENWGEVTMGPSGISRIARPEFFGAKLGVIGSTTYMYYIMIGLLVLTIFCVNRLQNSRIGRAWLALREDEIACQAMGIDKMKTKLMAFALGATWAGMAGVVFAAKTTFVNPASFTFWESAIILSIVVIGGMGSIRGVIAGAIILILVPEYLRDFAEFRMLLFGAIMVLVMVFRPQGLISAKRKIYEYKANPASAGNE
ncbi:high-affinity branched-chain amino acid ABC transporter permease LivM [Pseudodesulfovibrio cashew]|uniref:High-affinity branched-chain amino acid ABC transporter permease LivM n=1 Tax=Pseudodesulfovibrio cashew TaxID=2678688 RepID=A0A6I6JGT9_9BACT|nr:high-affinity branched-chain amino acid ABC transporter permease LivM [Pseudodesulfovibrio cashew]QGY42085.1 high-affinity branched-chain amino acid ABC transporter permease LivM [Pseudodesulfovibrio cashew]